MSRVDFIRNEEKKYHDSCYENYKLFEEGSWLFKPVKTVMDLLPFFQDRKNISVLDLGCGVGRNSIPIAKEIKNNQGNVVCVDLLSSAIDKLCHYAKEYGVEDVIELVKADIGDYHIMKNQFDFMVAVSSLEHISSESTFDQVLQKMVQGTKKDGINCIIVNSEVSETDIDTDENLDALMEINLKTEVMMNKLNHVYKEWKVMNQLVKPLEYKINRNERNILLKTNAITYVVRKTF